MRLVRFEVASISDIAPSYWSQYTDNMTWPGTYLTVVDMLYKQYGDTDIIHEHYGFMKKWLYYMRDRYRTDDYVMPRDQYGDWCPPPNNPFLNDPTDSTLITDQKLIGTAYYYYMLHLLEKFANILDLQDDAEILKSESIKVKNAYNKKFLNSESGYYSNNATTANILSLSFDLVPDDCKHKVYDNLKKRTINEFKGHVSSGIIGNQWLMRVFTQNGDPEIPFNMLLKTKYPSFGYMIEQGATTIWEHWNGNTMEKWIDSQNHVMQLGDLIVWFYENLAGIKNDSESIGFRQIIMKPEMIRELDNVDASFKSLQGDIRSRWQKSNANFTWEIEIPANTTATIYIPSVDRTIIRENGKKLKKKEVEFVKDEENYSVFKIGSGRYIFGSQINLNEQ